MILDNSQRSLCELFFWGSGKFDTLEQKTKNLRPCLFMVAFSRRLQGYAQKWIELIHENAISLDTISQVSSASYESNVPDCMIQHHRLHSASNFGGSKQTRSAAFLSRASTGASSSTTRLTVLVHTHFSATLESCSISLKQPESDKARGTD